jgi:hypothetical protein
MKKHWELIKAKAKDKARELKLIQTSVYKDMLHIEQAIIDSNVEPWVGYHNNPSAWELLYSNLLSYNEFHSNENPKNNFGKDYLDAAKAQYQKVYDHYMADPNANTKLKHSLTTLLVDIEHETKKCERKCKSQDNKM